jgi:glycyl-tRNA synthetase
MEMEFFTPPAQNDWQWYEYWRKERFQWYVDLGIDPRSCACASTPRMKLAHYSKGCTDVEYEYPFGWGELEGIAAHRLRPRRATRKRSGKDLKYFDPETKERYLPYVIEPAAGVDRAR